MKKSLNEFFYDSSNMSRLLLDTQFVFNFRNKFEDCAC